MTAPTPSNTLVALRPSRPAAVSTPWNRYTDANLCRIATYATYTSTTTTDVVGAAGVSSTFVVGLLGVFNTAEAEKREAVAVREFVCEKPRTDAVAAAANENNNKADAEGGTVVISSYRTGQVQGPLSRCDGLVSVIVRGWAWDILSAAPVSTVQLQPNAVRISMLGLVDKMSGPAAVARLRVAVGTDGTARVRVTLKALGKLGLWVEGEGEGGEAVVKVKSVEVDGEKLKGEYLEASRQGEGVVYKVDVLRYWQDKDLWSEAKEVKVDLHLSRCTEMC